ncbi:hypothetical protein PtrEW4_010229 [Pyrenophora tritici-repentis]|nr:hypothetical protein PtrEW4_010229 [Pyrenophora tritici-repentis]KAI1562963.1 hypothetical protein PtrEW7m1_010756 [Pyrenophora tritici-repentis]
MSSLLSDLAVRVAHYHMGRHEDKEYPVVTFLGAMQKVYLHDPNIINAGEKPPTSSSADRLRRVDSITHWCQSGSWDFHVGAVYECKKPGATPAEIETCEGQVYDACERNLRDRPTGKCYGFSGFGSFWRVFVLQKPGQRYTCLTGEGPSNRKYYVDVSAAEGMLIDSCFRDLREHMGFQRDAIRPDVALAYPPPPLNTAQLRQFVELKREGWQYYPDRQYFMRYVCNQWETHSTIWPAGFKLD